MSSIEAHGITDPGCVREQNEDRILMDEELGIYIVADGMGGHSHGAMAAELAISTVRHYVASSSDRFDVTWPFGYNFDLSIDANRMVNAIQLANRQVWRQAESAPEYSGMGTTVAAVLVSAERIVVSNVGDSRVYLVRDGSLQQLTVDDTWTRAISGPRAGPVNGFTHPLRNFLIQAVGSKDVLDVHVCEDELRKGDLVILTTDGVHGFMADENILSAFCPRKPLSHMAENLMQKAKAAGGSDNISVMLLAPRDQQ